MTTHNPKSRRSQLVFSVVILVVLAAGVWFALYVPANNIAWADSYNAAKNQAVSKRKPMMLFFTAKWCMSCRAMKRSVMTDDNVEMAVNRGFVPMEIDVDSPDSQSLVKRYHIDATPTTVVVDPMGNELARREGNVGADEFLNMLKSAKPSPHTMN
jgi:thiol:disulfide interchange protein